jgi:hypothetical protein
VRRWKTVAETLLTEFPTTFWLKSEFVVRSMANELHFFVQSINKGGGKHSDEYSLALPMSQ